jgi:putative adhesin
MSQETIERETLARTFTVPSPAHLTISNVRGAVRIMPGAPGQVAVTAVKHTHTGNADRTRLQLEQAADGRVTIAARFDPSAIIFFGNHQPCRVDFTIQAPPTACSITANGVSNSLDLNSLQGEFDLRTVSGAVTLHDLAGGLAINSVSGDVRGEHISLTAPLEVETVSGEVRLRQSLIPAMRGNTVSGDVMLETTLGAGPYDFSSVSGDIGLLVPPATACELELHTLSGDIATDLPVTSRSRSMGHQSLELNGGGVEVNVHSVSGSLTLMCTLDEATSLSELNPSGSRQEILERLERGELSVEDALQQLN